MHSGRQADHVAALPLRHAPRWRRRFPSLMKKNPTGWNAGTYRRGQLSIRVYHHWPARPAGEDFELDPGRPIHIDLMHSTAAAPAAGNAVGTVGRPVCRIYVVSREGNTAQKSANQCQVRLFGGGAQLRLGARPGCYADSWLYASPYKINDSVRADGDLGGTSSKRVQCGEPILQTTPGFAAQLCPSGGGSMGHLLMHLTASPAAAPQTADPRAAHPRSAQP
jgi:hypothetical protein